MIRYRVIHPDTSDRFASEVREVEATSPAEAVAKVFGREAKAADYLGCGVWLVRVVIYTYFVVEPKGN